jgi:hypothetical protein
MDLEKENDNERYIDGLEKNTSGGIIKHTYEDETWKRNCCQCEIKALNTEIARLKKKVYNYIGI